MKNIIDYIKSNKKLNYYNDGIEGKDPFEAITLFTYIETNGIDKDEKSNIYEKLKKWIKDNSIKNLDDLKFILYGSAFNIKNYPIKHSYIIDNRKQYNLIIKSPENEEYLQLDSLKPLAKHSTGEYYMTYKYFLYSTEYGKMNFIVMLPDVFDEWKKSINSSDIMSWSTWLDKYGKTTIK